MKNPFNVSCCCQFQFQIPTAADGGFSYGCQTHFCSDGKEADWVLTGLDFQLTCDNGDTNPTINPNFLVDNYGATGPGCTTFPSILFSAGQADHEKLIGHENMNPYLPGGTVPDSAAELAAIPGPVLENALGT